MIGSKSEVSWCTVTVVADAQAIRVSACYCAQTVNSALVQWDKSARFAGTGAPLVACDRLSSTSSGRSREVQRRPLEDMVIEQARKRAAALMSRATHTMLLEDQKPDDESLQKLLSEMTADRIDKPGLWDDKEG